MRTVILAAAASCALLVVAKPARAQSTFTPTPASAVPLTTSGVPIVGPMLGPPVVTWLFTQGDANGASRGDALGASSIIFEPIRLALLGSSVPAGAAEPHCRDSVESTGGASAGSPGFAMQHAAGLRVPLIPRLTLIGFSRGGCTFDAGVGGALVYATPITKDISLVLSAGIYHVPQGAAVGAVTKTSEVRMDVVFAKPKGRSYSVGVGTGPGITRVTFGGTL